MQKKLNYVFYTLTRNWNDGSFYWYATKYSRCGLIHRIALAEVYSVGNSILNNLSTDMSETTCEIVVRKYGLDWNNKYFIAHIEKGVTKVVDVNSLMYEIIEEIDRINTVRAKKAAARNAERRMSNYEFRRGPVPHIHNYKGCGKYYRHPATTNTKRKNEFIFDDECVEYKLSRSNYKINNLPTVYDDIVRHYDKSWKTSCKVRKQWQKHIRKHISTIYYNRKTYDIE